MALLLAKALMSSNSSGEREIRRALSEADLVECMVALSGQIFANTQIPACIWLLTKNKRVGSRDLPGPRLQVGERRTIHQAEIAPPALFRYGRRIHKNHPSQSRDGDEQ